MQTHTGDFCLKEELRKVPEKPGVYLMKDIDGKVIYTGKAINLKNRLKSYFPDQPGMSYKTSIMVSKIASFDYILTATEMEALILECNLIKKYKPKYNVLLKDDKTFPYIKVTLGEKYPGLILTRKLVNDGSKYFGPYTSVSDARDTMNFLNRMFMLKTCKKSLNKAESRPCLNFHIKRCMGPCIRNVSENVYMDAVKDVVRFLEGRETELIEKLRNDMKEAAEVMHFERAAHIRDVIESMQITLQKQRVSEADGQDEDVIACADYLNKICIEIFHVRNGKLTGKKDYVFNQVEDMSSLFSSFIKQYYDEALFIPDTVLVEYEAEDTPLLEEWLRNKKGRKVTIKVPKRGDKAKLLEMARENAGEYIRTYADRANLEEKIYEDNIKTIVDFLNMDKSIERIEAFDISNTSGSEITGSMVVFVNGKSVSSEYRKYRIKSTDINDYASMQEVLMRRLKNDSLQVPDLIFVDGGKGHVGESLKVLESLEIDIPVMGMVKDDKHRSRGLIYKDRELTFKEGSRLHIFVTSIQDEAHRFALEYNKKLREKRYRKSVLDDIPGVGEKRKKELIKHFKSVDNIKKAEYEELIKVKGLNSAVAEEITRFFRGDSRTGG